MLRCIQSQEVLLLWKRLAYQTSRYYSFKVSVCKIVSLPDGVAIYITVKILKIGTPEIITIIVLQLEQLDFTVQYSKIPLLRPLIGLLKSGLNSGVVLLMKIICCLKLVAR